MLGQGLPVKYLHKSLQDYGSVGSEILANISKEEARIEFIKKYQVINIYGGLQAGECLYALCRAFMLLNYATKIINVRDIAQLEFNDYTDFKELRVLGIRDFTLSEYEKAPFTESQVYNIENFIKWHLDNGGIILASSDQAISKFTNWYSNYLVRSLVKLGKDYYFV